LLWVTHKQNAFAWVTLKQKYHSVGSSVTFKKILGVTFNKNNFLWVTLKQSDFLWVTLRVANKNNPLWVTLNQNNPLWVTFKHLRLSVGVYGPAEWRAGLFTPFFYVWTAIGGYRTRNE